MPSLSTLFFSHPRVTMLYFGISILHLGIMLPGIFLCFDNSCDIQVFTFHNCNKINYDSFIFVTYTMRFEAFVAQPFAPNTLQVICDRLERQGTIVNNAGCL